MVVSNKCNWKKTSLNAIYDGCDIYDKFFLNKISTQKKTKTIIRSFLMILNMNNNSLYHKKFNKSREDFSLVFKELKVRLFIYSVIHPLWTWHVGLSISSPLIGKLTSV